MNENNVRMLIKILERYEHLDIFTYVNPTRTMLTIEEIQGNGIKVGLMTLIANSPEFKAIGGWMDTKGIVCLNHKADGEVTELFGTLVLAKILRIRYGLADAIANFPGRDPDARAAFVDNGKAYKDVTLTDVIVALRDLTVYGEDNFINAKGLMKSEFFGDITQCDRLQ